MLPFFLRLSKAKNVLAISAMGLFGLLSKIHKNPPVMVHRRVVLIVLLLLEREEEAASLLHKNLPAIHNPNALLHLVYALTCEIVNCLFSLRKG